MVKAIKGWLITKSHWLGGGNNFVLGNPNGSYTTIGLGWAGVTPVVGDWNGDGKTKVGVYDGNGTWALANSSAPGGADIVGFGWPGTTPIVGDWIHDGKTDIGVYDPVYKNFWLRNPNVFISFPNNFVALEAYNVSTCNQFPASTDFKNLNVDHVTPTWTPWVNQTYKALCGGLSVNASQPYEVILNTGN